MANAREIGNKIKSIQSTQKITSAMEMVAASKMRKARIRMQASRPYLDKIKEIIAHLIDSKLEYVHPYLIERPVKRIGCLIISSDRGLCGGLNHRLFKQIVGELKAWDDKGISADICTIGKKAGTFFVKHHAKVIASITDLGDSPRVKDLVGIIKVLLDSYDSGQVDQLYLVYNKFVSTIVQEPRVELLLPIINATHEIGRSGRDYIYEPAPEILLDTLLSRYIETLVYQGAVENVACEQAARMIAMKNASDNASDLIDDFKLMYNKARQAAVTTELAEIVAGAAAV